MNKNTFIFILIIIIIVLLMGGFWFFQQPSEAIRKLESNVIHLQRLADNSHTAQMKSLEMTLDDIQNSVAEDDSLLQTALNLIKANQQNTQSVVLTNEYYYSDTIRSQIIKTDTVKKDSTVYIYQTYEKSFSDEWLQYTFIAGRDTSLSLVQINNQLEYVTSQKREKWWKQPETHIQVRSLNPYSTITDLEHITVKHADPKLSVGISMGYGITSNLSLEGYVGVGIHYKLLDINTQWLKRRKKRTKTLLDINR